MKTDVAALQLQYAWRQIYGEAMSSSFQSFNSQTLQKLAETTVWHGDYTSTFHLEQVNDGSLNQQWAAS
jgi:hypothetical protein